MKHFNAKRPIYTGLLTLVVFFIVSLVRSGGKDVLYWLAMSIVVAGAVATVSLRLAIQEAKNKEELERIQAMEKENSESAENSENGESNDNGEGSENSVTTENSENSVDEQGNEETDLKTNTDVNDEKSNETLK